MIEARSLTLVHLIAGEGSPSLNMPQLGHHAAKVIDRFSVLLGGKADQPFGNSTFKEDCLAAALSRARAIKVTSAERVTLRNIMFSVHEIFISAQIDGPFDYSTVFSVDSIARSWRRLNIDPADFL